MKAGLLLQDSGIAQGGLIDTPDGKWFAYLFRDYGLCWPHTLFGTREMGRWLAGTRCRG